MRVFGYSAMTLVLFFIFFFAGTKFPGAFKSWPVLGRI